jgi:hypothetical protein
MIFACDGGIESLDLLHVFFNTPRGIEDRTSTAYFTPVVEKSQHNRNIGPCDNAMAKYYSPLIFCGREVLNRFFQAVEGKFEHGKNLPDHLRRPGILPFPRMHGI